MLDRHSIEDAAREYDATKYPEAPYRLGLLIVERAEQADPALGEAVRCLFEWKLARFATRPFNRAAIERAMEGRRLSAGVAFRDGALGFEEFKHTAGELTSTSIVLPAFYVHMWRPEEYPILDEKVWKVFCRERELQVTKTTKPHSWGDHEAYRRFFADVVARTGLDWRIVDRGLWVLGGRLKKSLTRTREMPARTASAAPVPQALLGPEVEGSLILPARLAHACQLVAGAFSHVPFQHRGIRITPALIGAAIEVLNSAPNHTLPQNCRQLARNDTPDGLDRRIKERLHTDLRTANIISDVLSGVGIVDVIEVINPSSGRVVKGTRLRPEWGW